MKLEIKKMKDYCNLHLKCDVLLLADALGKFRNNSLNNKGLSLNYYLRALALCWKPLVNTAEVDLKLIPDPEMFILFEIGTVGGFSDNTNKYSKVILKIIRIINF